MTLAGSRSRVTLGNALVLCPLAAILAAACAGRPDGPGIPLPPALRAHVTDDRFDSVTSVRGFPLGVREALQRLFGAATLDMAEPGAQFQAAGAAGQPGLPSRRLTAAGCSPDHHCLVYYERGGARPGWRVALFQWTPAETRFEWGGVAPAGLTTIDAVRAAVLTGAIKGPTILW